MPGAPLPRYGVVRKLPGVQRVENRPNHPAIYHGDNRVNFSIGAFCIFAIELLTRSLAHTIQFVTRNRAVVIPDLKSVLALGIFGVRRVTNVVFAARSSRPLREHLIDLSGYVSGDALEVANLTRGDVIVLKTKITVLNVFSACGVRPNVPKIYPLSCGLNFILDSNSDFVFRLIQRYASCRPRVRRLQDADAAARSIENNFTHLSGVLAFHQPVIDPRLG